MDVRSASYGLRTGTWDRTGGCGGIPELLAIWTLSMYSEDESSTEMPNVYVVVIVMGGVTMPAFLITHVTSESLSGNTTLHTCLPPVYVLGQLAGINRRLLFSTVGSYRGLADPTVLAASVSLCSPRRMS